MMILKIKLLKLYKILIKNYLMYKLKNIKKDNNMIEDQYKIIQINRLLKIKINQVKING